MSRPPTIASTFPVGPNGHPQTALEQFSQRDVFPRCVLLRHSGEIVRYFDRGLHYGFPYKYIWVTSLSNTLFRSNVDFRHPLRLISHCLSFPGHDTGEVDSARAGDRTETESELSRAERPHMNRAVVVPDPKRCQSRFIHSENWQCVRVAVTCNPIWSIFRTSLIFWSGVR